MPVMRILAAVLLSLCAVVVTVSLVSDARLAAAQSAGRPAQTAPTLGLEHGTLDFDTPSFTLRLVKDSQTIAALQPKGATGRDANTPFDFTPADQLTARQGDRFNHLGDITLRVRPTAASGPGAWIDM